MSDHYSPWLTEQGHAPYAWSVLGAVAHATSRVGLMTYVTCPTMRYHPAVVAQKAATVQLLAEGRFTLGLGSGENLNEHVVGDGWPGVETRQEMLRRGDRDHPRAAHRRPGHLPGRPLRRRLGPDLGPARHPVELAVAVAGDRAIEHFAPLADHLIAVEPDAGLIDVLERRRRGAADRAQRRQGDRADPDLLGPGRGRPR